MVLVVLAIVLAALAGIGLWAACAVYVLYDAERRNMPNPKLWLIGTLLFGPIGLAAYLMDRPSAPRAACPHCGESLLASDRRCLFCGKDIPPSSP